MIEMVMKNLTNTMILWDPKTGGVALKDWPEQDQLHKGWRSGGACYRQMRNASLEQRKAQLAFEFAHLVVRDGIDANKLHQVLLGLEEWRALRAADMPGAADAMRKHGRLEQ